MDKEEFLAKTKNGIAVLIDISSSHALTHFDDSQLLKSAVIQHLPNIEVTDESLRVEIECDSIIGNTDLVETSDTDEIVYALRPHRDRYSRFVKNRLSIPSKHIVVGLSRRTDGNYSLYTAFIGRLTPSFPGGDFMPEKSKEFWSNHALVFGQQDVIEESITSLCPW